MPLSFYPAIYKLIYSHNQLPAAFSLRWNVVTDKLERGYSLSGTTAEQLRSNSNDLR